MNFIPYLAGWERAGDFLKGEAVQLIEEGREPKWIEKLMATVDPTQADETALAELWSRLQEAPARADFTFIEPNGLAEIHAERTPAARQFPLHLSEKELSHRMLGAWLGRCCGCALGKPVEGFMAPHHGLSSRERIKTYLLGVNPDEYPLRDYFPGSSSAVEKTGTLWSSDSHRENIAFMETDDDIRYTVIGQKILLEKGANFTT